MDENDPNPQPPNAVPPPEPEPTPPETAANEPSPPRPGRTSRARREIPPETREEILRLQTFYGSREIARRLGMSRKVVRRVLQQKHRHSPPTPTPNPSKLDPFRTQIEQRVQKRLTVTRILREIEPLGYDGGRTILADLVRTLKTRLTLEPRKTVKRRFETRPGLEMQIDWSPYLVPIAGRTVKVHALGCLLASSRKLFVHFFRDERQPTLLEGLALAFVYFDGVTLRIVLDNMATAVLGRLQRGQVLWHPRFLDLTRHFGTTPFACKPRDPNRKGKKEKSFRLLEDDFIRGSRFASWEDLHERLRIWLDETPGVANRRVHGTTRRVPNEAFQDEHPLLIRLPAARFPVHEDTVRVVDGDATLSIRGTTYTVPAALAHRSVAVRLSAEHFEVLDPQGRVAFSRRYVPDADKGKLVIDPTHYATLPRRPRGGGSEGSGSAGGERLDQAFLRRFPTLAGLVEGLTRRMKALAPIHLRALIRLSDRYGEQAFLAAATRAQEYRRFDALAIERILERTAPPPDEPVTPLTGLGPVVLGEVEPASLDSYAALDGAPASLAAPESLTSQKGTKPGTEDPHGS